MHIPRKLARTTKTWWGDDGPRWLSELPQRIADLEARWSIELGPPFDPGGYTSYCAPARPPDGTPAVLKISVPDIESETEPDALRAWAGDGAVRVLAHAPDHHAMLLERCEPGTPIADMTDDRVADEIAALLLARLWRPVESGHPFRSLAETAAGWAERTWERFERLRPPYDADAVAGACRLMLELPAGADREVLVHGDFHPWNVLASAREPWLVIDPKPLVGDPAFDTSQYIGNRLDQYIGGAGTSAPNVRSPSASTGPEIPLRDLIGRLASILALDAQRIRGWALVREVEGALWLADIGEPDPGAGLRIALLSG
jgi:streptomycin 6-kinase